MSVLGTKRTSSDVRLESAFRGKADHMCSERVFRLLTRLRHQRCSRRRSNMSQNCAAFALGPMLLPNFLHHKVLVVCGVAYANNARIGTIDFEPVAFVGLDRIRCG
jgi:hypothetical protein